MILWKQTKLLCQNIFFMDICKGATEMNGRIHKTWLGKAMSISCVLNILKRKAWGGTSELFLHWKRRCTLLELPTQFHRCKTEVAFQFDYSAVLAGSKCLILLPHLCWCCHCTVLIFQLLIFSQQFWCLKSIMLCYHNLCVLEETFAWVVYFMS